MVKDAGAPVMCCGQKMKELVPGTVDAAVEKHVPSYQVEGNLVKVNVGSVEHPMMPEHSIVNPMLFHCLQPESIFLILPQMPRKIKSEGS